MVLRDKGYTGCTMFVELLTSGDLNFGHMFTKIFLCTPDILSIIGVNLEYMRLLFSEDIADTQTDIQTDGFTVLIL